MRWFLATLITSIAACSGGGGDQADSGGSTTDEATVLPAPVTVMAAASGSTRLELTWPDGAVVTLDIDAGSFEHDRSVTLRALTPQAGVPLRFEIEPAAAAFRRPATLRVKPSTATDSTSAPALRQPGGDWVAARLVDAGWLETAFGVAALPRPLTAVPPDPAAKSAFDLDLFAPQCRQAASVVAAAQDRLVAAAGSDAVVGALALLANLRQRCAGVAGVDDALRPLASTVAVELPRADAAWQAADHGDLARFAAFRTDLLHLLAWCGAAQVLELPRACTDGMPAQSAELTAGFAAFLAGADDLAPAQQRAADLVLLAADARRIGVAGVDLALAGTAGAAGRLIVDRAWALCSMVDLAQWGAEFAALPGAYEAWEIEDGYRFCGTRVDVQPRDATGAALDGPFALQPGDFDGDGAFGSVGYRLPTDSRVAMRFSGPAMRCGPASSPAEGHDEIVWRVGSLELGRRRHDGDRFDGPELELAVPALLSALGRLPDSEQEIRIEIWRVDASIDCRVGGTPVPIVLPDARIYTVQIIPQAAAALRAAPAS